MNFPLRLIPLLPFLGAVLLMLFGRKWSRDTVFIVAALAIGSACMVSIDSFFTALPDAGPAGVQDVVMTWIATGTLHIDLAFRMDALSGVMCLVITFVGFFIHVFAAGYMADDPDYARFFAYLNLFCGAMLVLVLGDSLPVMFIGWEGVGLCSYLLIGFWYRAPRTPTPATRRSSPTGSATSASCWGCSCCSCTRARCRSRTSTPPRRRTGR